MNPTAPPLNRTRLAAERQARSAWWRVVYALGSLRLAMILLGVLAVACIAATVSESKFSTKVAAYYVYNAPWFQLWLAVLCVNLIMVTLTRLPWEKRHVGFVVTHYGIVTLLVGSVIGHFGGFEGTVTLTKGGAPGERIVIDETLLYVQPESTGDIFTTPYDPWVRVPQAERPRRIPLPGGAGDIEVSGRAESLRPVQTLVEAPADRGSPGVAITLVSGMVPQPVDLQLVRQPEASSTFDLFGRGRVEWRDALPPAPPAPATNVPTFRETQIILQKHPDQPVADNTTGKLSGYRFALLPGETNATAFRVGILTPGGRELVRPLDELYRRPFRWDELDATISVQEVWLDFAMKDGRPVSASNEPRNPAMLVHITGQVDPRTGNIERVLQLAPAGGDRLAYRSLRGGVVVAEGEAQAGTSFRVGWADWQAQVKSVLPAARLAESYAETPPGGPAGQGVPGLRVALRGRDGVAGQPVWLPQGTSQLLEAGGEFYRIGFGLKTRPLGFRVELDNFRVPRQPGTEEPADFISSVTFRRDTDGRQHSGEIKMNDPESFPPGLWRAVTGLNYKFSQAGWDPNQLDQTTLQVLHDPGWFFKWFGSLGICAGIAIMFYWKPGQRPQPTSPDRTGGSQPRTAVAGSAMASCLLAALLCLGAAPASHAAAEPLVPEELESVPVQHRGRIKPFLAFAQESLTTLYGRGTWREGGEKLSAMQVVTGLWLQPEAWQTRPLILVEYGPLREALGLSRTQKRFPARELAASPALQEILTSARSAPRDRQGQAQLTPLQSAAVKVADRLETSVGLFSGTSFRLVPHRTHKGDQIDVDEWKALSRDVPAETPGREAFEKLGAAWPTNAAAFAKASALLHSEVLRQAAVVGTRVDKVDLERTYLRWHPFQWSYLCLFAGVVVMALGPVLGRVRAYRLVWALALAGFALQVAGITVRVLLSGRAPVTNMYETVIWLAAGVMLFALVLEAVFRCRYYLYSALPVAGMTLILADLSPAVLDSSINPLVPVLRDNFWLTIHVLTVTSSYAAFALALVVGHVALWQVCFRSGRDTAAIYQYLYRAMQIGVLLLAAGTILGGVWANYSWGRFWGWDPKETWALISLLGYLFLLHGRITGWWGGFGLAVGSIICFQLVLMTWYGVNFILGTGLHSYGRGSGGMGYVVAYLIGEAVFLTLALVRKRAFHPA